MENISRPYLIRLTDLLPKVKVIHLPIKRIFDIAFSAWALLFFAPIILLLVLFIRLESPGNAIYACSRVGRGGRLFKFYKLRSMYADADKKLNDLLNSDPLIRKEWDKNHKLKNDPRVTRIGRFIRKTSLDEFLQFWNVIIGDLSVVGPRPYYQQEIEQRVGPCALEILSVRPGLTGIWQTSGRSDTTFEKRVELDIKYVRSHSFFYDLKLIAKTIHQMAFSKGAY